MATTSYIPLTWKNMDLSDPRQMKVWQAQMADWANQIQNAVTALQGPIGTFATVPIMGSEMNPMDHAFGGVSGTVTFDATGASEVIISLSMNANTVLVINNLTRGVPVMVDVVNGFGFTFHLQANDPASNAYTVRSKLGSDTGTVDISGTGVVIASGTRRFFWGTSFVASAELLVSEN